MGNANEKCPIDMKIMWFWSVGPKWQIVIPKEIRTLLNVEPGDNLVFLVKDGKYMGLVKNEDVQELMDHIKSLQW
jgi:AbrB family looped-hinge helix DNA binding protein